jgi:hypothetical protein
MVIKMNRLDPDLRIAVEAINRKIFSAVYGKHRGSMTVKLCRYSALVLRLYPKW